MSDNKSTNRPAPPEPSVDDLRQTFLRKAQRLNEQRIHKANAIKMRNRLSGLFMATVVGSIYFYTIFAVKQEKFLDELEDPEPTPPASSTTPKK